MSAFRATAQKTGEAGLPFLVIGGYAVMAHGLVRVTDDTEELSQLAIINHLDLNESELQATIVKHGDQELY